MRIHSLTLRPFRNFEQLRLVFESDHVLILGPNGRGKSNILEAISYLSIGKSARGATDQQAVPFGGEYFDIQALCDDGASERTLRIFYDKKNGKRVFCDEQLLPRVADLLGLFKTVHFSPEDVSLVLRFPARRRRLLDILISQSSLQYLRDLQRYQRVLQQRNTVLRGLRKASNGYCAAQACAPWTMQLAQLGGRLRGKRQATIGVIQEAFANYYHRFVPFQEKVAIEYRGAECVGEEALVAELQDQLTRSHAHERRLGYTLSGPHRDDLVFILNGQSADTFASEGQLKTMLIAWKMAEVGFLQQSDGNTPVLLLDDVFSELDRQRITELLKIIDEFAQVLVTTPQELEASVANQFFQLQLPAQ